MSISADPRLAVLALNRFGLGPKSGEIREAASDPRGYLAQAVRRKAVPQPSSPDLMDTASALVGLRELQMARKAARAAKNGGQGEAAQGNVPDQPFRQKRAGRNDFAMRPSGEGDFRPHRPQRGFAMVEPGMTGDGMTGDGAAERMGGFHAANGGDRFQHRVRMGGQENPREGHKEKPLPQRLYAAEIEARTHIAMSTADVFAERLVWFWSNHFAVSVMKGPPIRVLAGAFEREAIRPHVFGRFADMLRAVEQHPAMLIYLDNRQSVGPHSRAGERRKRGLNENLAREIMELHTLGVDGGYTQADVTTFAKAITGWTIAGPNGRMGEPGTFTFNRFAHEPGDLTILGKTYPEGGIEQGEAVLNDLARHPATARHISTQLARHFVADDPPPALVARLERTFRETDGDLAAVSLALLDAPEAWQPQAQKIRSPQEFMMASLRLLGHTPPAPAIMGGLRAMGQPLWGPGGPNGYADTFSQWASPEGMKTRLDFAGQVGQRLAEADPRDLLEAGLGPLASQETRQAILRAESRPQAVALLLMSPEFQRR